MVSSDLSQWTRAAASVIGTPAPIPGNPGYQAVEMQLPASVVAGQDRLFVLIAATDSPGP